MRNDRPWFPMYGRDYRTGCMGVLSLEEAGAYSYVLTLIYEHGGRLPDRDDIIAKQIGASSRVWRRIRAKLLEVGKLSLKDGYLSNRRASVEIQERDRISDVRAEAGRKGGLARSSAEVLPNFPESLAEVSPKLSENAHAKPLENKETPEAIATTVTITVTDREEASNEASVPTPPAPEPKRRGSLTTPSPSAAFVQAWALWPRKDRSSKARAVKSWKPLEAMHGGPALLAAVRAYLASPDARKERGAFVPGFERWLPKIDAWLEGSAVAAPILDAAADTPERWAQRVTWWRDGDGWPCDVGPPPDQPGFLGPDELYAGDIDARRAWKKAKGLNGFHPAKTKDADLFGGPSL